MQQTTGQAATFKGKFAVLKIFPARLSVKSTQITLRCSCLKYRFYPDQVVDIEKSQRSIRIRHILSEYPSLVYFSSSVAPEDILEEIGRVGFISSASENDLPDREMVALRLKAIGITIITVTVILCSIEKLLGFTNGIHIVSGLPIQLGPIHWIFWLIFVLSAQYIPIVQGLIIKPGVHIGEVKPLLFLASVILSTLLIASCAMQIGVPQLLALLLSAIGIRLWIGLVDPLLNDREEDE